MDFSWGMQNASSDSSHIKYKLIWLRSSSRCFKRVLRASGSVNDRVRWLIQLILFNDLKIFEYIKESFRPSRIINKLLIAHLLILLIQLVIVLIGFDKYIVPEISQNTVWCCFLQILLLIFGLGFYQKNHNL